MDADWQLCPIIIHLITPDIVHCTKSVTRHASEFKTSKLIINAYSFFLISRVSSYYYTVYEGLYLNERL